MTRADPRLARGPRRAADPVHRAAADVVAHLPAAVDLRTLVPAADWPVWDQGGPPSCTAHAVAGVTLFEMIVAKRTPLFQPSRLFLYYCERVLEKDVASEADCFVIDGAQVVLDRGVCADVPAPGVPSGAVWLYDPSEFATKPPATCFDFARGWRASSAKYVAEESANLRGCLAEGHPFTICIRMFPSFDSGATTGDIPMPTAAERPNPEGGHAMAVVGYDDAKGRFLVRNSFGPTWGDGGYGTLPYEYVFASDLADSFWTLRFATD